MSIKATPSHLLTQLLDVSKDRTKRRMHSQCIDYGSLGECLKSKTFS